MSAHHKQTYSKSRFGVPRKHKLQPLNASPKASHCMHKPWFTVDPCENSGPSKSSSASRASRVRPCPSVIEICGWILRVVRVAQPERGLGVEHISTLLCKFNWSLCKSTQPRSEVLLLGWRSVVTMTALKTTMRLRDIFMCTPIELLHHNWAAERCHSGYHSMKLLPIMDVTLTNVRCLTRRWEGGRLTMVC